MPSLILLPRPWAPESKLCHHACLLEHLWLAMSSASSFFLLCHASLSSWSLGILPRNYTNTFPLPFSLSFLPLQLLILHEIIKEPFLQCKDNQAFGPFWVNSSAHGTRCSSSIFNSILALILLDCNHPFICLSFLNLPETTEDYLFDVQLSGTLWHGVAHRFPKEGATLPSWSHSP